MTRLLSLARRHLPVTVALMIVLGGSAYAAVDRVASSHADRSRARIYACVTKHFQTLNLTTPSAQCPHGQRKISWNAAGRRGRVGARGRRGARGPAGVAGARGEQGARGPAGARGVAGPAGVRGAVGPAGPSGAAGPAGPTGPAAPVGAGTPRIAGTVNADGTSTGLAPCTTEHVSPGHYQITCPTSVFGGAAVIPIVPSSQVQTLDKVVDVVSGTTIITIAMSWSIDQLFYVLLAAAGAHGIAAAG